LSYLIGKQTFKVQMTTSNLNLESSCNGIMLLTLLSGNHRKCSPVYEIIGREWLDRNTVTHFDLVTKQEVYKPHEL
jgi:hypothetical protein